MTALATPELKTAMDNPSKVFKRPADVLQNADLTRAQKIGILRQWEVDARLLSVAEEENMTQGEPSPMAEVVSALIALGDENKDPEHQTSAGPSKQGG
jgi:hypothetical protein